MNISPLPYLSLSLSLSSLSLSLSLSLSSALSIYSICLSPFLYLSRSVSRPALSLNLATFTPPPLLSLSDHLVRRLPKIGKLVWIMCTVLNMPTFRSLL